MDLEYIPALLVITEFALIIGGLWLYRRRKLARMTPQQRAGFLKTERQYLDG